MKKSAMLIVLSCAALSSVFNPAHAIKKCQDAEGKWHYGDTAVTACENSKVTVMNDRGAVKEELAAPKSEAELRTEEEAFAVQKAREERKLMAERERNRILSVYETEADIDRQRENQLYSVQSNIEVHKAYLKNMRARVVNKEGKLRDDTASARLKERLSADIAAAQANIKSYKEQLAVLEKQKLDIVEKFKREKKLYRELTGEEG